MYLRFFVLCIFFISSPLWASGRISEFYRLAVPSAERFTQRVIEPESDENFAIYTLFDNLAILASGPDPNTEYITALLHIAETMQNQNSESPDFGNFRWYRNHSGVTDPNAAEFAAARMLSIYLDTPQALSDENKSVLNRMLAHTLIPCLSRRINPDYTNIALYNAVHLILLGQVLGKEDAIEEGTRRLQRIVFNIWEHGIFEYNSPSYYSVDLDALQFGLRHCQSPSTRQMLSVLLDYFWTDLALHWFQPGKRLAGAQSRTHNYLYGTSVQLTRHFAFAGLTSYDSTDHYHALLNSFRAEYQPPPDILRINQIYPRQIVRRWGNRPEQRAITYMFDNIALGTAGTKYDSRQNMVQTVDIADEESEKLLPRCYFIADGRCDPYGIKSFPTGKAGQQKPLHLDSLWFGSQRTTDSLGISLYPPECLADPMIHNVQSHYIIRKPESIWISNEPVTLSAEQTIDTGNMPIIFRYKTCAFGIRVVWARHQNGTPAKVLLVNDRNEHGVYRLTIEHGPKVREPAAAPNAGAAFWIRIGSQIETDEQFTAWQEQFVSAKIHRLNIDGNKIDIAVTGRDGIVSVKRTENAVQTEPAAPAGILTLDGKDLGKPILETIPQIAKYIENRKSAPRIIVNHTKICWEAESAYSYFVKELKSDATASGGTAVQTNEALSWKLQINESGEYIFLARVKTKDNKHDSVRVEVGGRQIDWPLGVRKNWTWVRLPVRLESGKYQLTIKPREYDAVIDRLGIQKNRGQHR